jgi:eukaryotic-like serine/threonine-protein kinase
MLKELFSKFRGSRPMELPGYAIGGVIREGSMSIIYRAVEEETGATVALKVQKSEARKAIEKMESRYRDFTEGQITEAFDHPNIIKCFDHGDLPCGPYLLLEYLEGQTLATLSQTDSSRLQGQRIAFILQAASAMAHVHAKRICHRDFCGKNLFVTTGNQVKVLDFGLATPILSVAAPSTRVGTAEILAPEILRREPSDNRVDIFAWGVVAYETMTGHWPFESPEHHQTLSKILNVKPVPVIRRAANVPEEVSNLIMRCLEKDPSKRLSSMNTAVGVLERHKAAGV